MRTIARRLSALLTAFGTFAAALLVLAATASADTTYPVPTDSTSRGVAGVQTDNSPAEGGTLPVSGTGCAPNTTLTISLDNGAYPLGTATTEGTGNYSTVVNLPDGMTGTHTLTVTGDTCSGTEGITIEGSEGGALASTGVAVVGIGALGAVLLVGGGLMLLAGRRRGNHA